jgi:periplasmic divalent cation tolerance protein
MERALLLYTTFPDAETALLIGEELVRDKLAACVNVLPGMRSVYAWKGTIERAEEAVAIVKSRTGLRESLGAALKERHPYKTPILFFVEPEGADPDTLAWLVCETSGEAE